MDWLLISLRFFQAGDDSEQEPSVKLSLPHDGYAAAKADPPAAETLRAEIVNIFAAVRWWEKDAEVLKVKSPEHQSPSDEHNGIFWELPHKATGSCCRRWETSN